MYVIPSVCLMAVLQYGQHVRDLTEISNSHMLNFSGIEFCFEVWVLDEYRLKFGGNHP